MKPASSPYFACFTVFLCLTVQLQAHPGHEGHELIWDLAYIVAVPFVTLGCVAGLVAGGWAISRRLGWRTVAPGQSLREAPPIRGK